MIDRLHLADPPAGADQNVWVDATVARLAIEDREMVEDMLASRIAADLAQWRLDRATLWQRVRMRLRFIRKQHSCVTAG